MKIPLRRRRAAMVVGAALAVALGCGGFVAATAVPAAAAVGTPSVSDDVSGVITTNTDDIVTCSPSTISVGGTTAVAFPAGCLTLYYGDYLTVGWSGSGIETSLVLAAGGNFILYAADGKQKAEDTSAAEDSAGPGCKAQFQDDGNLVVRNCASAAIWAAGSNKVADEILCFQADGNLVIYEPVSGTYEAVWATGTNS